MVWGVGLEEELLGVSVKLKDESFFPGRPGFFVGSIGVGIGEEEEGIEAVAISHDGGEFTNDFGIVDVFFRGEAPEGEVVVDEEHDESASAAGDLESFTESSCQDGRAINVFANVFGSSGVVKNQCGEEGVWVRVFEVEVTVDLSFCRFVVHESIELIDASEGVFVSGVAMEEFVLDKAVERGEFWEEATENSATVHQSKGAGDLTFVFENFAKGVSVFRSVAEGFVDEAPMFLD